MQRIQVVNFASSILLESASASLYYLAVPAGPVACAIFGAVHGAVSPIGDYVSQNLFPSQDPRASEATKTIAAIVPWIFGVVSAYFTTIAAGFELRFIDLIFLGIAAPICGTLAISIVARLGMQLATCTLDGRIRAAFQNN